MKKILFLAAALGVFNIFSAGNAAAQDFCDNQADGMQLPLPPFDQPFHKWVRCNRNSLDIINSSGVINGSTLPVNFAKLNVDELGSFLNTDITFSTSVTFLSVATATFKGIAGFEAGIAGDSLTIVTGTTTTFKAIVGFEAGIAGDSLTIVTGTTTTFKAIVGFEAAIAGDSVTIISTLTVGNAGTATPVLITMANSGTINPALILLDTDSTDGGIRIRPYGNGVGGAIDFGGLTTILSDGANAANMTSDGSGYSGNLSFTGGTTAGTARFIFLNAPTGTDQAVVELLNINGVVSTFRQQLKVDGTTTLGSSLTVNAASLFTGDALFSNANANVTIGDNTNGEIYKLIFDFDIADSESGVYWMRDTSTEAGTIEFDDSGATQLQVNNALGGPVTINVSGGGNMGVGDATPGEKITIGGVDATNGNPQNALGFEDTANNNLAEIRLFRGTLGSHGILKHNLGTAEITILELSGGTDIASATIRGQLEVRPLVASQYTVQISSQDGSTVMVLDKLGRMGIGVSDPATQFEISGTVPTITFTDTDGSPFTIFSNADKLQIRETDGGAIVLDIAESGDVGFLKDAELVATGTDANDIGQLALSGGGAVGSTRGASVTMAGNEDAKTGNLDLAAGNVSGGEITFDTGGTQGMVLDENGNLGVGTVSPAAKVHVSTGGMLLDGTGTTLLKVEVPSSGIAALFNTVAGRIAQIRFEESEVFIGAMGWDTASNVMYINTFGAEGPGVNVDSSDNVGIGTADIDELLHLESSVSLKPVLLVENTNANASGAAIILLKNSASQADDDTLGNYSFKGKNSGGAIKPYAHIRAMSSDISTADEGGKMDFQVLAGGTDGTSGEKVLLSLGGEDVAGGNRAKIEFNPAGIDADFIVKTDDLFVDGGTGSVGIGTNDTTTAKLTVETVSNANILRIHTPIANGNPNIEIINDVQSWKIQTVGARSDGFEIADATAGSGPDDVILTILPASGGVIIQDSFHSGGKNIKSTFTATGFLETNGACIGGACTATAGQLDVTPTVANQFTLQISSQDGSAVMVVDKLGFVGIGATASPPDVLLHVSVDAINGCNAGAEVCIENSAGATIELTAANSNLSSINFSDQANQNGAALQFDGNATHDLSLKTFYAGANMGFYTGITTLAMSIDSSQNVGIGETAPNAKLEVKAALADQFALQVSSQNGTSVFSVDKRGQIVSAFVDPCLSGTPCLNFTSAANNSSIMMNIENLNGSTSGTLLQIISNSSAKAINVIAGDVAFADDLGVGTLNPEHKLDVVGGIGQQLSKGSTVYMTGDCDQNTGLPASADEWCSWKKTGTASGVAGSSATFVNSGFDASTMAIFCDFFAMKDSDSSRVAWEEFVVLAGPTVTIISDTSPAMAALPQEGDGKIAVELDTAGGTVTWEAECRVFRE